MRNMTKLFLGVAMAALLSSGSAAASSISLSPLSAQYGVALEGNGQGSVSFPLVGGAIQIDVPAPAYAVLALTTPSGTTYHSGSGSTGAVEFHFTPAETDPDALGPQQDSWLINIPSARPGEYTLDITDSSRAGQGLPVSVRHLDSALRTGASVGLGQGAHQVGEPVVIAAFVYDGTTPVPDATISASMVMVDGTPVASAELRDDGIAPDTTVGDGTYVAVLVPNAEGTAAVRIDIHGRTATGKPYHASHGALLAVGGADELRLSGEFQDQGVDLDGDGLFDELRLHFGYSGEFDQAPYGLRVILEASNGQRVDGYGELIGGDLVASIPASVMGTLQVDGPYEVVAVILDKEGRLLERRDDLGATGDYTRSDWDRNALQFGSMTEEAVDTDADGLADELRVTVAVESLVNGSFGMSLDLSGADGNMIATTAISSTYLEVGTNQLSFAFPGAAIGESGQDGPYLIGNALLYPNFNSGATAFADVLGSTRPYQCREFVECDGGAPLALLDILDTEVGQASMSWSVRLLLKLELGLVRAAIEHGYLTKASFKLDHFVRTVRLTPRFHLPRSTAERLLAQAADLHEALGR